MNQQLTADARAASEMDRLGTWVKRVFWPVGGTGKLGAARRATAVLTVIGSLVQIVVWMLISVFSRHLDSPWWLFYAVGGTVVASCLWIVDESGIAGSTSEGNED